MKKLAFLIVLVVGVMLNSCTRKHTCECEIKETSVNSPSWGGNTFESTSTSEFEIKGPKKEAKELCTARDSVAQFRHPDYTVTTVVYCELR